jgi:hypothetical protein
VVKKKMQFHKTMIYVNDPVWISDTTFMALDFESYKERFYILNDDLNCSPVYNPYFHFNKNISKPIMSDIFSTFTSVKADKSKIVLAGRYFDCLEIYDTDGICLKIVKGPNKNFTIKYDELKSDEKNRFVKSGETKRAYLSVKSTNSRIYALYSGKKHRYSTDLIYVFDWDGNPLAKYKLDCIIAGFDVEMDNQTIYAIKEDDLSIIRFDISNENLK